MKRINPGILLIIFSIALCGCIKQEIKNLDAKGESIICFGDSITFGYGAAPGEDYPTALGKMVKLTVINAGVDGDTSLAGLERLEQDVLSKKPRLVIVEFCGNDFLKKIPKETTVKNLSEIIDRIQAQGTMVALVDISAGMFFREYRAAFKRLAEKKQAIFIPVVLNKIITNPAMKSDFFHPNARGYKIIARRVYNAIEKYIK
ncbi:MAG: GDSL-type esterase/lipase family protein [Candidatus Omnitrophica bacterium]|jgi:lysophospholipase L1-like esterase|nr:GDSL-type esterase/lipase family protein [Candidatus Omnitrophota bacterium]MDD5691219.1 GDSL-type esterase/lipase family protein [Candidatus Omnitrophota bacterium]